jgi:hypothetical protein
MYSVGCCVLVEAILGFLYVRVHNYVAYFSLSATDLPIIRLDIKMAFCRIF